jgi:hypothetical protein
MAGARSLSAEITMAVHNIGITPGPDCLKEVLLSQMLARIAGICANTCREVFCANQLLA